MQRGRRHSPSPSFLLWMSGARVRGFPMGGAPGGGALPRLPAESPGKVQGILEPNGGRHRPDGQGAVAQQLPGPLDAVAGEVIPGRAAELRLKGPVQAAAADPRGPGGLLHPHGPGVVALDIGGAPAGVVRQGLPAPAGPGVHQEAQGCLEIARHSHGAGIVGTPGLVHLQQSLAQLGARPDHRSAAGKGGLGQQQRCAGPGEAHPVVLPGVLPVRLIVYRLLRPHQKGLPRFGDESPARCLVGAPAGDDVVDEVVVPDAGAPAVPRRTLLKSRVVYHQRQLRPLRRLEGMLEIPCHAPPLPFHKVPVSSIPRRKRFCNKNP